MALIFAIEPNRQQAAQLTKLVHRHTGAELVLADTTERAIDAMGQRVPDLVLVPPLLSPQDDAALAGALRAIVGGAHVQTLTIPTLANQPRKPASSRMLAMLRREQAVEAAPDGCDPTVFAEQVVSYLKRAAEEQLADAASSSGMAHEHGGVALERELSPLLNDQGKDQPDAAARAPLDPILDDVGLALEEVESNWLGELNEYPDPLSPINGQTNGGRSEWGALIESLRQDLECINVERPIDQAQPVDARTSAPQAAASAPQAAVPGDGGSDEFGLFNPRQCGLPSLLHKLDLLTEEEKARVLRRGLT